MSSRAIPVDILDIPPDIPVDSVDRAERTPFALTVAPTAFDDGKRPIEVQPPLDKSWTPSDLPKPKKGTASLGLDPALRPHAEVLYRSMRAAGVAGVPWIACWEALVAAGVDTADIQVGRIVTWLRFKGVEVVAFYEGGETRFRLEP